MKKLLSAIYQSFYSKRLYAEAAKEWRGLGFSLLFILLLIETFILFITYYPIVKSEFLDNLEELVNQFPETTVQNGKISISEPVPYTIRIGKDEPLSIVIDTRYSNMNFDDMYKWMNDNKIVMFVGQSKILTMQDGELSVNDASEGVGNTHVTKEQWHQIASDIKSYAAPVIVIGFLVFGWIAYVIMALFFGLIGLIINAITSAGFDYVALVRISCVSFVPVNLIDTIISALAGGFEYGINGLLYFILIIAGIIFGIISAKKYSN